MANVTVVANNEVEVSYTEPTTTRRASDGALIPLDDLVATRIYYQITGQSPVVARTVPATALTGGGAIVQRFTVPVVGTQDVTFWFTAIDEVPNESATSPQFVRTLQEPAVPAGEVTFGAASSGLALNATTLTFLHTLAPGANAVFVGVGTHNFPVRQTVSVTYGGVVMAERWDFVGNLYWQNSGHLLVNPPVGTVDVVVTLSGQATQLAAGAVSLLGVDIVDPVRGQATANGAGSAASVMIAGVITGDLVVSNLVAWWVGATPGADETERWERIDSNLFVSQGSTQPGSAGGTISPTRTSGGDTAWQIGAIAFKPAAGDTTPPGAPEQMVLLSQTWSP